MEAPGTAMSERVPVEIRQEERSYIEGMLGFFSPSFSGTLSDTCAHSSSTMSDFRQEYQNRLDIRFQLTNRTSHSKVKGGGGLWEGKDASNKCLQIFNSRYAAIIT